jgi:hypothetical protein
MRLLPSVLDSSAPEATLMDTYLDQLSRVVKTHALSFLRYVVADGPTVNRNL